MELIDKKLTDLTEKHRTVQIIFVRWWGSYGSPFVPHKRKILCRYNNIYIVITIYFVVITIYDIIFFFYVARIGVHRKQPFHLIILPTSQKCGVVSRVTSKISLFLAGKEIVQQS